MRINYILLFGLTCGALGGVLTHLFTRNHHKDIEVFTPLALYEIKGDTVFSESMPSVPWRQFGESVEAVVGYLSHRDDAIASVLPFNPYAYDIRVRGLTESTSTWVIESLDSIDEEGDTFHMNWMVSGVVLIDEDYEYTYLPVGEACL